MTSLCSIALWTAVGRGDHLGVAEGILIIVGIVAGLALLGFLGHLLIDRFGRTKRESLDREPHQPGRVGRAGKRRGP